MTKTENSEQNFNLFNFKFILQYIAAVKSYEDYHYSKHSHSLLLDEIFENIHTLSYALKNIFSACNMYNCRYKNFYLN